MTYRHAIFVVVGAIMLGLLVLLTADRVVQSTATPTVMVASDIDEPLPPWKPDIDPLKNPVRLFSQAETSMAGWGMTERRELNAFERFRLWLFQKEVSNDQ